MARRGRRAKGPYRTIEPGGHGETYHRRTGYTVYEHGVYPRHSVLAGQPSRRWLDHFDTLEAAKAAYPDAELIAGSTHIPLDTVLAGIPDDTDY